MHGALTALVLFLPLAVIVLAAIWSGSRGKQAAQAEAAQDAQILASAQQELDAFRQAALAGTLPDLSPQVGGVILNPHEKCIAIAHGVGQIVPHKQTRYVGGSHGVSLHVAKGVTYRVGSFRGRPVTSTVESMADTGNLYVTTQRVIFSGSAKVASILISKVADARLDLDRVEVMAENKPPLVFQLSQKYRGALMVAAIHVAADLAGNSD